MSQQFPDSPWFKGNFAPISFEAEADNVPVRGDMPSALRGTLYRNGPNPQFAPRDANHHWFIGDGMIHAFHIEDGRVVVSQPLGPHAEMANGARRAQGAVRLLGQSDDHRPVGRSARNRRRRQHQYRLACRQAAGAGRIASAVRARSATRWRRTARGISPAASRAARSPRIRRSIPKPARWCSSPIRPADFSPRRCSTASSTRPARSRGSTEFEAPYSAMVHDFLVTRNYVLFPILPLTGSLERAMSGKPAYRLGAGEGRPCRRHEARRRRSSSMRWFRLRSLLRVPLHERL